MGSAFVGIQNDPATLYWNPAGIASIEGVSLLFDHTSWFADVGYNFFVATYNIEDFGTLGLSFIISDIGEMDVTTIQQPEGTGQKFSATDLAISIAYAIQLTENFAIGFNPKFIYQSIWNMNASTFAVDLGMQYKTPFDGMILAMSVSNFGTKMQLEGNTSLVLYDSDPESDGNNDKIPAYLETNSWALPLIFRVGVAYDPIKSEDHHLTLALDALHPSDNYESVNVGAEYTFMNLLSLRGGYKSLFLDSSEETFALGFGIQKQIIGNITLSFDYSYQDFGRLSDIQKFSFGMKF
jgi:opacity protein-like surface antigen